MSNSIYRRTKGNSYLAEQDSTTFLGLLGEMKKSEEFSVSSDKYAKKKKKRQFETPHPQQNIGRSVTFSPLLFIFKHRESASGAKCVTRAPFIQYRRQGRNLHFAVHKASEGDMLRSMQTWSNKLHFL